MASLCREGRVGGLKRLNTLPKSAEVMPGISMALKPVGASGLSKGMRTAQQVNSLEMLVAEGRAQSLA